MPKLEEKYLLISSHYEAYYGNGSYDLKLSIPLEFLEWVAKKASKDLYNQFEQATDALQLFELFGMPDTWSLGEIEGKFSDVETDISYTLTNEYLGKMGNEEKDFMDYFCDTVFGMIENAYVDEQTDNEKIRDKDFNEITYFQKELVKYLTAHNLDTTDLGENAWVDWDTALIIICDENSGKREVVLQYDNAEESFISELEELCAKYKDTVKIVSNDSM